MSNHLVFTAVTVQGSQHGSHNVQRVVLREIYHPNAPETMDEFNKLMLLHGIDPNCVVAFFDGEDLLPKVAGLSNTEE